MITILLSTYGNSPYLPEFISSLQHQTLKEFQLVYRSDGEDCMPQSLRTLLPGTQKLADESHCGVVGSYGKLITGAPSSDYYMCADQDDVWHPDKLEKTLAAMQKAEAAWGKETPILIHSDLRVVDEKLSCISDSMIRFQSLEPRKSALKELLIQNNVTGCTMMFNRALRDLVSFPSEAICHDWYLALIASAFGKIVFIDESLIDYRQHSANVYGAVPRRRLFEKLFQKKILREKLQATQKQAAAFREQFKDRLTSEELALVSAWAENLHDPSYLKRLFRAWRWGFRKNDLLRTLGMWWAL